MPRGRLEAQITVPAVGWSGTINDSGAGGAVAWTITAGTYYLKGLLEALSAALNAAATTDTITVSYGGGEGGTGKVTIASSGTTSIVWTSSQLRDLLGYESDLASGTSFIAPNMARSAWLADCPYNAPNEIYPWQGEPETDARTVESASGLTFGFVGASKDVTWLEWRGVARTRAIKANEATENESFERFIRDGVWGLDASWGRPGGPIRFYPNASSANYVEYSVVLPKDQQYTRFVDGWAGGPRTCRFERLIARGVAGRDDLVPTVLTYGSNLTNLATYTTASVTPVADRPVYVDVASTNSLANVTSVSGCSLTWTQVSVYNLGNLARVARWRGVSSSPTAGAITIVHGAVQTSCAWVVTQIEGTDPNVPEVQTVNGGAIGSQSSLTTTLAALESGTNGHLCAVVRDTATALAPDAGFTELAQLSALGESLNLSVQWALNVVANVSTFATASQSTASISTEIKSATVTV